MARTFTNTLFLDALSGEPMPRPPVWLMRQAGRTDPEYNALKERVNLPLEKLFSNAELAAEISLLPKRIGVDAIIYFQDILTPLGPMGCEFVFRPGPTTDTPIQSCADVERLQHYDVAERLPFIAETFRLVYNELDGEMPALGFAGAPLTLAVFMIEGCSFGGEAPKALSFIHEQPKAVHALLEKLTDVTIDYLKYQAEAGAAAVQLFESAAHLLSKDLYREFALPYQQRIFEALRDVVPTIMFAREWEDLELLDASGADVLSIHSTISVAQARSVAGKDRIIQGNFDNRFLVTARPDEIERSVAEIIGLGERRGHIFNLSHGLLRQTPFENVQYLVQCVRNSEAT